MLTTESIDNQVVCNATNGDGIHGVQLVDIKIDKTPPTVNFGTQSPAPNGLVNGREETGDG